MTMFRTFKPVKLVAAVATIVAFMLAVATPSQAQTGAVRLNILKVGFIVGAGGGSGTLSYHGRTYRLSVGGVSLGSLGVAGADLVGTASNLHRPSDIAGTYGAAGAGFTFVGGGQVATRRCRMKKALS
jgi:hypothetical protein